MTWVAGWNIPGYLPEMHPETFDSWEDAREFLINEIESFLEDSVGSSALIALLREAMADDSFQSAQVDGYVYWIVSDSHG